jgi:cell division initiation protein
MLTPAEISGKEFKRAVFTGYDMAGVDDFLEEVLADYTAIYKENGILKNKLKVLVEKIEEYRSTEDSMRMALLTAQKTGDEIVSEARRKGEEISARMESDADERRQEIENEIADERARLDAAARETERFVIATRELITAHTDFLSRLSSVKREIPPTPEPTREDEIRGAAREIDASLEAITGAGEDSDNAARPSKRRSKQTDMRDNEAERGNEAEHDDEGEETSPRPKFKFDDLKFGINLESN